MTQVNCPEYLQFCGLKQSRVQTILKFYIIICCCAIAQRALPQTSPTSLTRDQLSGLTAIYKQLHAMPELSGHEEKTAALLKGKLEAMGYQVIENLGRYSNRPWKGYGLAALLKNGPGPVVLVRTEMDGLPVKEQTGLQYASRVMATAEDGKTTS